MLRMSQINDIRDLRQMGYGISRIAEKKGLDRKTVRKYLEMDDFSPEPPVTQKRKNCIITPYKEKIEEWLREDAKVWPKQRHTAKRIYDRLRSECGYSGSYETVQKYLKEVRREQKTTETLELVWEAGTSQVDFGESDFDERDVRVRRPCLTTSFPFSNDGFSQVFRGETAECVCQGLKDIFEYIGGVPRLLIFDNATGVGRRIKDKVIETELFQRFRAHYGFMVRFCNPHAGHEKGNVENKVGTTRRNLFVPVPSYWDIEVYNRSLLEMHEEKASEIHYKKQRRISELFEEDKKNLLPLPAKPFNVCRYETHKADGYGKVCLDGCHYYSTRPEYHGKMITVGIRAHYIDILNDDGSILVTHMRSFGSTRTDTNDYSTSIAMLTKNVGAWGNSGVRMDASEDLRNLMDSLDRKNQRNMLKYLQQLTDQYGYDTALDTLSYVAKSGVITEESINQAAAQISLFGNADVTTPLEQYDIFLQRTEVST